MAGISSRPDPVPEDGRSVQSAAEVAERRYARQVVAAMFAFGGGVAVILLPLMGAVAFASLADAIFVVALICFGLGLGLWLDR